MKQNHRLFFVLVILSSFLVGCAAQKPLPPYSGAGDASMGDMVAKVDNILVILDASDSMNRSLYGNKKIDVARETLRRFNQLLPDLDCQLFRPHLRLRQVRARKNRIFVRY